MNLSEFEFSFIEYQIGLLQAVVDSINFSPEKFSSDLRAIIQNIETIKSEISVAKEDDLSRLFHELNIQQNLYDKFSKREGPPSTDSPYFGYMKLSIDGKQREILIGHQFYSVDGKNIRIVDWRNAPIASVFYNYDEGEEFSVELDDREIDGILIKKAILTISKGKLYRIDRGGESWLCDPNGTWQKLDSIVMSLSGGEGESFRHLTLGTGLTGHISPQIASLLDKEQYKIINNIGRKPLLLIGGAGSGKTTVALHRLASLCEKRIIHQNSSLVIVPHEGLVRLSKDILFEVGLRNVKVRTNEDWFKDQVYHLFPELTKRITDTTPLAVSMLKRHGAMKKLIGKFIDRKIVETADQLKRISSHEFDLSLFFLEASKNGKNLLDALQNVFAKTPLSGVQRIKVQKMIEDVYEINADRLELLYDRSTLEEIIKLSDGVVTSRMVEETLRHTRYQVKDEEISSDKEALDRKDLNADSLFDLHNTIDLDDFPIMLYILMLKTGGLESLDGSIKDYDHIILDEAQELTPIELAILGKTTMNRGSITIAGDAAQQIDPTISFHGWDKTIEELGYPPVDTYELKISYRSPQTIVDFSHDVLGPYAPSEKPKSKKVGGPVIKTHVQHLPHAAILLKDALNDLMIREKMASVCIICCSDVTAELLFNELKDLGRVRRVFNAAFEFRPGVDIATVDQIRGLEFDYVIIPDANGTNYPDNMRSRKRMHLAATRAIHQLWVMCPGKSSPIIPVSYRPSK